WYERNKDVVNERSHDRRIKRKTPPYMRPRLRSAYLSIKRNMPLLWTFYDHPELGLPNTNNGLEGIFSDLKTKLRVHSGIKREQRKKLIDEYLMRHY
ncbi:MAG: transposase, partial [Bacteroidales bacterium]|nr:transposase [Bacteroidales bacterium]